MYTIFLNKSASLKKIIIKIKKTQVCLTCEIPSLLFYLTTIPSQNMYTNMHQFSKCWFLSQSISKCRQYVWPHLRKKKCLSKKSHLFECGWRKVHVQACRKITFLDLPLVVWNCCHAFWRLFCVTSSCSKRTFDLNAWIFLRLAAFCKYNG